MSLLLGRRGERRRERHSEGFDLGCKLFFFFYPLGPRLPFFIIIIFI